MRSLPRAVLFSHLLPPAALLLPSVRWPFLAAWGVAQAAVTGEILRPGSATFAPNVCRAEGEARRIALTFDDGPRDGETQPLLDRLEAAGARASFFVVGVRARANASLIRRVHDAGHTIGNHTLSHPLHWSVLTRRRAKEEVAGAQAILGEITGFAPEWFRPPMGHKHLHLAEILEAQGLKQVTWSIRSFDTLVRDAGRVLRRVLPRAGGGDILLFHEGLAAARPGEALSLDLIDPLIAGVRAKGLDPVSLEALLSPRREAAPEAP
jgi:peptidoglycan/xylan/chitin deacetylase (PgdA/CDA1 family)